MIYYMVIDYFKHISTTWPDLCPGLTIEYGKEGYRLIYGMVKYKGFCIKRVFGIDGMSNLERIKNTMEEIRDEIIEKGEKEYCHNDAIDAMTYALYSSRLSLLNTTMPKLKKIILNDPATIILWSDNTKTIVKKNSKDKKFDPEKGIALCYMKRALGNKGNYNNIFKEWIK